MAITWHGLVTNGVIPLGSLDKIAELAGLDATSLRSELSVFPRMYELLCHILHEEFNTVNFAVQSLQCDSECEDELESNSDYVGQPLQPADTG
jgi:hypothetical protein